MSPRATPRLALTGSRALPSRRMTSRGLLLLCALGCVLDARPALAEARSIAVLPVAANGVAEEDRMRVVGDLIDELRRLPDVTVRRLDGAGSVGGLPTCLHDDLPCLTAVGEHLGVTHVVSGLITPEEDGGFALDLRAVDTRSESTASRVELTLPADARTWGPVVRQGVTRLLAPDALTGVLVVSVDRPGATVLVDGVAVGTSPLDEPVAGLPLGRHELEVRLDGHKTARRFFEIVFGEVTSERVVLEPGEAGGDEPAAATTAEPAALPPLQLAGGATAGVGVLLLAAGGGALGYAIFGLSAVAPVLDDDAGKRAAADQLALLRAWTGTGYGLLAAGAVATAVGAGMFGASTLLE